MSVQLWLVLACGILALIYGGLTIASVLKQSAGTARMRPSSALAVAPPARCASRPSARSVPLGPIRSSPQNPLR